MSSKKLLKIAVICAAVLFLLPTPLLIFAIQGANSNLDSTLYLISLPFYIASLILILLFCLEQISMRHEKLVVAVVAINFCLLCSSAILVVVKQKGDILIPLAGLIPSALFFIYYFLRKGKSK